MRGLGVEHGAAVALGDDPVLAVVAVVAVALAGPRLAAAAPLLLPVDLCVDWLAGPHL